MLAVSFRLENRFLRVEVFTCLPMKTRNVSPPSEVLTAKGMISLAPSEDGGCFPLGQRPLAVKAYTLAERRRREGFHSRRVWSQMGPREVKN